MDTLVFTLVILPFLAALFCYFFRSGAFRSLIVLVTGALLITSALFLIPRVPFIYSPGTVFGVSLHGTIQAADFLLLFVILYFGLKHHSILIALLALIQILLLGYLEVFLIRAETIGPAIYCDNLSLIMVLIVSVVGSTICFQAIPYMKDHESHRHPSASRQHGFFFVMLLFLGAMNGLVLANDMVFFYFFFEVTTLCSFLLIRHDGTERAIRNGVRALWMNSLGGAVFLVALIGIYKQAGTLHFQQAIQMYSKGGLSLLPLALICLSAFTKAAQFPFQSWLLGAMVAPTPVSALLHSSTMVKVGVYLVLRWTPAIKGTLVSECVALFGAFTFLAAAALAVGQRNGKKVLAYSTISNLGLIFACAGLNTAQAFTAAVLLIIFHAVVKALLFLCVGAIEQRLASRDIEDMKGLYARMPVTALLTVAGVIMMIMPPFGVILSKWMAIEAAARNIHVVMMIALGSTLTVVYWARWAGILMSDPFAGKFRPERQPLLTWGALISLCLGGGLLSLAAPWIYKGLFTSDLNPGYVPPFVVRDGILENTVGVFALLPLCLVAAIGFIISIWAVKRASHARIVLPYLSGIQSDVPGVFRGPMNRMTRAEAHNYYLSSIFGEQKLTGWINLGAGVLLTLLLGVAL